MKSNKNHYLLKVFISLAAEFTVCFHPLAGRCRQSLTNALTAENLRILQETKAYFIHFS